MADKIYKVLDPQGNLREISGPDGASDSEVIARAKELFKEPSPTTPAKPKLKIIDPGTEYKIDNSFDAFKANLGRNALEIGNVMGLVEQPVLNQMAKETDAAAEQFPIASGVGRFAGAAGPLIVGGIVGAGVVGAGVAARFASPMMKFLVGSTIAGAPGAAVVTAGQRAGNIESKVNAGIDREDATASENLAAPVNFMGLALPVGAPGKLLTRAATGAGINVAAGAGARAASNLALPEHQQQDLFPASATAVEAGLGAVMSGVFGARSPDIYFGKPKSGAPPNKTTDVKAPLIGGDEAYKTQLADLARQKENSTARIADLQSKLEDIDPNRSLTADGLAKVQAFVERTKEQINSESMKLKEIEALLVRNEVETPTFPKNTPEGAAPADRDVTMDIPGEAGRVDDAGRPEVRPADPAKIDEIIATNKTAEDFNNSIDPIAKVATEVAKAQGDDAAKLDWEDRFLSLSDEVKANEKQSDPNNWTPAERSAYDKGDWREFSRIRGYTQKQIDQFQKYIDSVEEGRTKFGLSYDDIQSMEVFKREEIRAKQQLTPTQQSKKIFSLTNLIEEKTRVLEKLIKATYLDPELSALVLKGKSIPKELEYRFDSARAKAGLEGIRQVQNQISNLRTEIDSIRNQSSPEPTVTTLPKPDNVGEYKAILNQSLDTALAVYGRVKTVLAGSDQVGADEAMVRIQSNRLELMTGVLQKRLVDINKELLRPNLEVIKRATLEAEAKKISDTIGGVAGDVAKAIAARERDGFVTTYDPNLDKIARTQGIDAALDHITTTHSEWATLAKWFKNNKFIRPFISEDIFPNTYKHEAEYDPSIGLKGTITGKADAFNKVEHLLHEIGHAATYRIFTIVDTYRKGIRNPSLMESYKTLTTQQKEAANSIIDLYEHVLKTNPALKETFKDAMEDSHEFFSYGLTNAAFRLSLHDVKGTGIYKFSSALKQLLNNFKKMIGLTSKDPKVLSAFDELFIHSKSMIESSKGQGVGGYEYKRWTSQEVSDLSKAVTSYSKAGQVNIDNAEVLTKSLLDSSEADSGRHLGSRYMFGKQQFEHIINTVKDGGASLVKATLQTIRKADTYAEEFENFALHGVQSIEQRARYGIFVSLKAIQEGESVPHLIKTHPIADWMAVQKKIYQASDQRWDMAKMVEEKQLTDLTPKQLELYQALENYANRVREWENNFLKKYPSMKEVVKKFGGYHPAVRKGDYEVVASYRGLTTLAETHRTRAEAEALIAKMMQDPGWRKQDVRILDLAQQRAEEMRSPEYYTRRREEIKRKFDNGRITKQEYQSRLDEITIDEAMPAKIGGHHLYRSNVPGYEGRKLYQTPEQAAKEFQNSYLDATKSRSILIRKAFVQDQLKLTLADPRINERFPNQVEISDRLLKMYTNEFDPLTSKMDKYIREFTDNIVIKGAHAMGLKDWYPQTHAIDKTLGVSAHLFYLSALTSRPGFWLAQALTSTQAMRLMFHTDSNVDAFVNIGKGMINVLSGGDDTFKKLFHHIASTRETFHPNMTNEMTTVGFEMKGIMPWLIGEKQSAAMDALSRYMSFAMFYEKYKAMGFKGIELANKAADDTDVSMVMYSAKDKAPMIRDLGIVGEAVSPLQTFATAQWANMYSDLRYWRKNNYELRKAMPLMVTGMTTMLMAGAIGLPFIAEYEAMRMLAIWGGMSPETIPSVIDVLNREETMEQNAGLGGPRGMLSYGVPSSTIGLDVGSGMRFNGVISKVLTEDKSITNLFPAVEFGRQLATAMVIAGKGELPDDMVTQAENRKALMLMSSFVVGGKAIMDEVEFGAGSREFVPGGTRGYAMREQEGEGRISIPGTDFGVATSTLVGSSTLKAKQDAAVKTTLTKEEDWRKDKTRKYVDVALDGIISGDSERTGRALDALVNLGVDSDSINRQLENAYAKRNIPERERFYMDRKGRVRTKEQQRRYQSSERFIPE